MYLEAILLGVYSFGHQAIHHNILYYSMYADNDQLAWLCTLLDAFLTTLHSATGCSMMDAMMSRQGGLTLTTSLAQGIGAPSSGTHAAIQVPWMAEQPTAITSFRELTLDAVSRLTRDEGCLGQTIDVSSVTSSLAESHSDRSTEYDRAESGHDDEIEGRRLY